MTTIGDQANFADCLEHLRVQTAQRTMEIIDRVAPLSSALQQMHERCRTPYYIQVDEDMLLFPGAVETLEQLIGDASPETAMICAPLWDCDTEHPIYGLKIYKHDIVRRFPYEDTLSCETRQLAAIRDAGFVAQLLPLTPEHCLGEHGKHYTPETVFKRWQRMFRKQEQLGNREWVEPWAEKLLDRYIESRDRVHLFAFLGAVAGITGDALPDRESDFREPNAALLRALQYFPAREKCE